MRCLLSIIALAGLTGCITTPPMAPKLNVPAKPLLTKSVYQLSYSTELESARIKSVQLPAHPVKSGNTVYIDTSKVSMTDTLRKQIIQLLKDKGLTVVAQKSSDYHLVVQQLDLSFGKDKVYVLNKPEDPHPYIAELAQTIPSKQCSNIIASLSMRLTHKSSSDVIWFAKSSINSAGYQGIPLQYTFTETEKVTNEHAVISFIVEQNQEEARRARYNQAVEIPPYHVEPQISPLVKTAGACNKTEVSALTSDMMHHLSRGLIEKLNVLL
ncbi:hypothetical protein CWB99_11095 [Pseudoalteromonas rubra]|uniref:Uncharacterized protein n=1 Tax=Pseudoalteromonas rubra TaxID=43658 RepID=A0A5S3WM06_9GAMM|nr:hypothetical protein [Pseudoalteromonas rubra]TMP28623.1 hypothetical protein CWB99_11095 [Pseudoalteromonas rubra]TMP30554.1 hypothetical protein CWC00_16910 [Pseudoalteromonas rubra]